MADVKGDLSGIAAAGATPRPCDRRARQARSADRRWSYARLPGDRSGTCSASRAIRSARPSPRWARCCSARLLDLNDDPGRRAQHRLQGRRRRRPAAARPQGPAGDAAVTSATARTSSPRNTATSPRPSVGAIQRALLELEQQGGDAVLRRAGARHRRPDADRRAAAAASSTSSPPTS